MKPRIPPDSEIFRYLSLVLQLGLTMIICIVFFFLLAVYLDGKLGTRGLLIPAGIILGVISGGLTSYRTIKKYFRDL
ncbi:MAG: AtpZ/AtpI family protein [Candidatus Cloacimonetes bacterium]|nr:AtpZ/AtpI family protein [Candidatus Cloacimonadota bacterium]